MRQKNLIYSIFFITILLLPSLAYSQSHYKYIHSPKTDVYFGYISYTEVQHDGKDPVVLREGKGQPEVAVLNLPLTAGDTIQTTESRRCEIQFDTGTLIRLDLNTELKIETILAQSLSSQKKITNLVLNRGQIYIMYTRYSRKEVFQVMTPNTAVKLDRGTIALMNAREDGSTDIQVKKGKASVIYGRDEEDIDKIKLKKLVKLTVLKDHKVAFGEYREDADFELWNDHMNENFMDLHEGRSFLPKPIQRLPKAVFYFAQKYSNIYGEWIWNPLYGYVWRPHLNDRRYPWGYWSPYTCGSWSEVNGQLFWVPAEPWGWVPYHLGLWMWNKKSGWMWIPGSAFAPAWVAWDYLMGYYTWRPWFLLDWYYSSAFFAGRYSYYSELYGNYDYLYWRYYDNSKRGKQITDKRITKIRKDQLKKKEQSPYPMPKTFKKAYKAVVAALKKGDERILTSLENIPDPMIFVKSEDLNELRIQEKSIKFNQFSEHMESSLSQKKTIPSKFPEDPYKQAIKTFRRNNIISSLEKNLSLVEPKNIEKKTPSQKKDITTRMTTRDEKRTLIKEKFTLPKHGTPFPLREKLKSLDPNLTMRFRDWNPDVKVALRRGVTIRYSSRTNEVRCPALGLSSRNVVMKKGFSRGGFYSSGRISSSGFSSSSSSSRGSGSSSRGSSGAGSRGSSSGSGREK